VVPYLLAALDEKGLGVAEVDYLFLTHVHLDHTGGAGQLMRHFPAARAVLHPSGARHMIDPAKLVESAKTVFGEQQFQRLFGEIRPVPAERVLTVEDGETLEFAGRPLEFLHTAGHARHHFCMVDEKSSSIFTGDTFGLSYRELAGSQGEFIYASTPLPQFDPAAAHHSIDRIAGFDPKACYLTHYGPVFDVHRLAGDLHESLDRFVSIARQWYDHPERHDRMCNAMFDFLSDRLSAQRVTIDPVQLRALLEKDIEINVQGLEFWLERESRQG
jgi:glyoxylase-like metal-dependent hydrolase (beta-lactamase superfamily II)